MASLSLGTPMKFFNPFPKMAAPKAVGFKASKLPKVFTPSAASYRPKKQAPLGKQASLPKARRGGKMRPTGY